MDNDRARLVAALDQRYRIEHRCYLAEIDISISQQGHYWLFEFAAPGARKPLRAEWWPLSAKLVFDGKKRRAVDAVTDAEAVWRELRARWPLPTLTKPATRSRAASGAGGGACP